MANREPTEMELRIVDAISGFGLGEDRLYVARAAIRAMREPTTDMLREAGLGAYCSTEDISYMWQTMIDTASPKT